MADINIQDKVNAIELMYTDRNTNSGKRADIKTQDYNGYTSLISAYATSEVRFAEAFVKFIVEQGVDVNIENNYGDTDLDIAGS